MTVTVIPGARHHLAFDDPDRRSRHLAIRHFEFTTVHLFAPAVAAVLQRGDEQGDFPATSGDYNGLSPFYFIEDLAEMAA